jgi:LytS/YehU family sensor histidine kinase
VLVQKNIVLSQQSKMQNLKIRESNLQLLGVLLVTFLLLAIAFLFLRQNKMNALNAKLEMNQKLLRSQMNPHFIFNAMVGIQSNIYKDEPELAANYLSSIAHLTRSIIENSKEDFVLLEKEIATLKHYLILQELRFQGKFTFTIETDPQMETEDIILPPMLLQPFIENAIVHGVIPKTDGTGLIQVHFQQTGNQMIIEITDNGVGREKSQDATRSTEAHLSVATTITTERLAILNRKSKKAYSFQIIDLKDANAAATGTKTIFTLPLLYRADQKKIKT